MEKKNIGYMCKVNIVFIILEKPDFDKSKFHTLYLYNCPHAVVNSYSDIF